jgi:urease accessory protein
MVPIIPMSIEASQFQLLLNWMSPAFPVGAFAYSHGLEWAIEEGIVRSADDLKSWIADLVTRGSGWNDAVLFSQCWDQDAEMLNEFALALASSKERHLETTQLGRAFGIAASVFQDCHPRACPGDPSISKLGRSEAGTMGRRNKSGDDNVFENELAYPIAAGVACRDIGIEKLPALLAFLQGFANALVSVAVRLLPLGQTAGLEVIRDLMPIIAATAERAASATLDDLGSITILSDIAAMKHETQLSRVFRT